jgi:hypothetical protein
MKKAIGKYTRETISQSHEDADKYTAEHPMFKYYGLKVSRNGKVATLYACDNYEEAQDI